MRMTYMELGYIAKIEVDAKELDMIINALKGKMPSSDDQEKLDALIDNLEEVKYLEEDEEQDDFEIQD